MSFTFLMIFFVFFFFFWWDWGLSSGLRICKAGTLLLEPHLQFFNDLPKLLFKSNFDLQKGHMSISNVEQFRVGQSVASVCNVQSHPCLV
jgi:hypothetical protein